MAVRKPVSSVLGSRYILSCLALWQTIYLDISDPVPKGMVDTEELELGLGAEARPRGRE